VDRLQTAATSIGGGDRKYARQELGILDIGILDIGYGTLQFK